MMYVTWVCVDQSELQRPTSDDSRASGQEIQAHDVFKEGAFSAWLGPENGDSGERDLFIKSVIPDLVDDVD